MRAFLVLMTCGVVSSGCVADDDVLAEVTSPLKAPTLVTSTNFSGNGFSLSWDGRFGIVTRSGPSWNACVFRPENLAVATSGGVESLNFKATKPAFSTCTPVLTQNGQYSYTPSGQQSNLIELNAHALVPAGDPTTTPYRSNADGTANPNGTAMTYDVRVYAQVYNFVDYESRNPVWRDLPQRTFGSMRFRIIITQAMTDAATVGSVSLTEDWQPLATVTGGTINGLEPTLTNDGHLMIFNSNAPDSLWYTVNPNAGARTGWSSPREITRLYADTTVIGGRTLQERYPLARKQLKSNLGELYSAGESLKGAYPWVSWEGADLFYMSTTAYDQATRASWSVVGESTGGQIRNIDGAFREIASDNKLVLFTAALATTSTMWSPFKQLTRPAFPTLGERPAGLFLHSNGNASAQVSFKGFFDGAYVTHLAMNRAFSKITTSTPPDAQFAANRTPDTSGRNAYGSLVSEARVAIFNTADALTEDFVGDHIRFKPQSGVNVSYDAASLDTNTFSIELAVRPLADLSQNSADAWLSLVSIPGVAKIVLAKNRQLEVTLDGAAPYRSGAIGTALPLNTWSHVALTWNKVTERLFVYVDGTPIVRVSVPGFVSGAPTGALKLGPSALNAAYASGATEVLGLDEVKISKVVRSADEIADSAYRPLSQRGLPALTLDSAVNPLDLRVAETTFTQPVAQLGSLLFRDPRLSSTETVACATCHDPSNFFTDGKAKSTGVTGVALDVTTPTLINRGLGRSQHWNGKFASPGLQAWAPLTAPNEMGLTVSEVLTTLQNNSGYQARFTQVFGAAPSKANVELAISAFVNSIVSGKSRYDRFTAGDTAALSSDELAGKNLFFGKARCSACHTGVNFSDDLFHDTSFFTSGSVGRKQVTGRSVDDRRVKTPTLRNVTKTAPYLHDGSKATLAEVLELYVSAGAGSTPNEDSELKPLTLTATEKNQLLAFLKALESAPTYAFALDLDEPLPNSQPPAIAYTTTTFTFVVGRAITAVTPTNSGGAITSCSVSPALPSGLTLNAATCAITGTPTVVKGATAYTVTAKNFAGSSAKTLNITVNQIAPNISYSPSALVLTKGVAMTAKSPSNTGGSITSCTVSPTLPAGLSLSTVCVVSGTPTSTKAQTAYTITATNSAGSSPTTLTLTVNERAPAITYSPDTLVLTKGVAMTAKSPANTGGGITSCGVTPALPTGLSLSSACVLSGTPTVTKARTVYTVTASNSAGSSPTPLTLTVNDPAPAITYALSTLNLTKGTAMTAQSPTNSGGPIVSCTASPTLPTGLTLAATTCKLSGTPTVAKTTTTYTITATNSGGSDVAALNITVTDNSQPNLVLTAGAFTLTAPQSQVASNLRLTMQTDGNLVVYTTAGTALWSSKTAGRSCTGCTATFQANGNLVLQQNGTTYWQTNSVGGSKLFVTDTAPFMLIRDASNHIVWSGGALSFKPGELSLVGGKVAAGADVMLAFQTDGNLVVYSPTGVALWASNTIRTCSSGCVAAFQPDGNLVLYQQGSPYFASGTNGALLKVMNGDPAIGIYDAGGAQVW